jgi:hypothetical protein
MMVAETAWERQGGGQIVFLSRAVSLRSMGYNYKAYAQV